MSEPFDEVEHNVEFYDAGPQLADRYTAVFKDCEVPRKPGFYMCLGMSAYPFHPQGIGQHSEAMAGEHLGARISFEELPPDCQRAVMTDLADLRAQSPEPAREMAGG